MKEKPDEGPDMREPGPEQEDDNQYLENYGEIDVDRERGHVRGPLKPVKLEHLGHLGRGAADVGIKVGAVQLVEDGEEIDHNDRGLDGSLNTFPQPPAS